MHTVSDQLVDTLIRIGVKQIFGIPANTVAPIIEAIRKREEIDFIIMRNEETGALAASAQAKLTGKLAVCLGCQGPGAIHLINGLYDAKTDHCPVLAITGQQPLDELGIHIPQEIDLVKVFDDVSIYNRMINCAENAGTMINAACTLAIHQSGVAHLNIPMDVAEAKIKPIQIDLKRFDKQETLHAAPENITRAADLINQHKNITVLYGRGAMMATNELLQLAEQLNAPLVHTTRSKEFIDNTSPYYVGGIGFMGTKAGNEAIQSCDLLLVVGSSFAFKDFYPKKTPIIQIDHDIERIGLHCNSSIGLVGDANVTLQTLLTKLNQNQDEHFLKKMQSYRQEDLEAHHKTETTHHNQTLIHPQALTAAIGKEASDDAIFCVDAGSVSFWANIYLTLNGKQRHIWSTNLGTLGFGLSAGIGAQFAYPTREVIVLSGDGGFDMLIGDFATAVKYHLPIIFVVYNNSRYGFIDLEQQANGYPVWGTDFVNPDYAALAKAFGGDGVFVDQYTDIAAAMQQAKASNKPFIIDVAINPHETYIPPKLRFSQAYHFAESEVKTLIEKHLRKRRVGDT